MSGKKRNPLFMFYCPECGHKVEHNISLKERNLRTQVSVQCEQLHTRYLDIVDLVVMDAEIQEGEDNGNEQFSSPD